MEDRRDICRQRGPAYEDLLDRSSYRGLVEPRTGG